MKRTKLFLLLLTLLCVLCVSAQAEEYTVPSGSLSTKLAYLKNVFPEGWYWNEWTDADLGSATQKTIRINGYTTTISTKPCTKHTSVQDSCNSFNSGSQCTGWARMLFTLVWDITPYNNGYMLCYLPETDDAYLLDYLKPGDIVWTGTHSMFVMAVNGDTLTVSDCNASYTCGIQWSRTITKTKIHSTMKSNGKGRIWSPTPFSISSSNWEAWEVVYSGGLNIRCQPFAGSTKIVGGVACGEIFRIDREHVTTTGDGTWAWCKTSDGESGWIRIDDYSLCVPSETEDCPHENTRWVNSVEGTCTEYGLAILTCIDCGAELDTQTWLGHSHEWTTTKEPTCEEDGEEVASCVLCGEVIATEAIPATGHSFDVWVTTKEPTCTVEGEKYLTCTKCGDTAYGDLIPALGHTEGDWVIVREATCTEAGEQGRFCTVCGEQTNSLPLPAYGVHSGEWITTKEATCGDAGEATLCCTVCGMTETAVIDATGMHTYGTLSTTKEATCTEEGEFDLFCTVCGDYLESGTLPATGHTEGEWVVITEATATADGLKRQSCTVCGETLAEETIPATGDTGDTPQSNITMSAGKNLSVVPGETVTVPISISNPDADMAIGVILLRYSLPEGVTITNVEVCGIAAGSDKQHSASTLLSNLQGIQGSGQFLKITFQVAEDAAFPVSVKVSPEVSILSTEEDIALPAFYIEIEEGSKRVPGDVNDDGKVSTADFLRLSKYLAEWPDIVINESNSDVNGDGKVSTADFLRLAKYLAGWPDIELK